MIYISITFNNPLKACFSNMKYILQSKAPDTNCISIFLNEKTCFSGFLFLRLLVYSLITYHTFFSDLACNKISKVRYYILPQQTRISNL